MTSDGETIDYTQMAADIVSAYVTYNHIAVSELPELIVRTREAVANLGTSNAAAAAPAEKPTAAAIRRSVTHEALISFEDGRSYKTLKRHLASCGLTPDAYRSKWGLPADYPMVAPGYAERRSQLAKGFGLGRLQRAAASEPVAS